MLFRRKRPTIGLALGAGGARGYAHIGVIKALEKHGIPIDYIAGSSIGALIGGLYAQTKDIEMIEQMAFHADKTAVRSFLLDPCFDQGLCKGTKFHDFIAKHVGDSPFKDNKIPFIATSTDIHTGNTVLLQEGPLSDAIHTSCAIPMLFKPKVVGNYLLTDGGLSMPVPVKVVKDMGADIIIAVNISQRYYDETKTPNVGLSGIFFSTYGIMVHHLANEHVQAADICIAPPLESIGWRLIISDEEKKDAIALGEQYTQAIVPQLQGIIEEKRLTSFSKAIRTAKGIPAVVKSHQQALKTHLQTLGDNLQTLRYRFIK